MTPTSASGAVTTEGISTALRRLATTVGEPVVPDPAKLSNDHIMPTTTPIRQINASESATPPDKIIQRVGRVCRLAVSESRGV